LSFNIGQQGFGPKKQREIRTGWVSCHIGALKMRRENAGHEFVGYEIAGHETIAQKWQTFEVAE